MGSNCYNQRLPLLTVSLLLLTILSSTQLRFMAQGRAIPQLKKSSPQENMKALSEEDNKTMVRARIGSRPPRCERRCRSCGHCEAIQVPTNPQLKFGHSKNNTSHISNVEYARDDSSSNYKPMSWKCKCGDFIFNP